MINKELLAKTRLEENAESKKIAEAMANFANNMRSTSRSSLVIAADNNRMNVQANLDFSSEYQLGKSMANLINQIRGGN